MAAERNRPGGPLIASTSPRAVFADLVGCALTEIDLRPSPMATAYLVELLDGRVRAPEPDACGEPEATLTEALFAARLAEGPERIARLRQLGDRTLFVAGFFGDSLKRGVMGRGFYREVGRSAYGSLAAALAAAVAERTWPQLFEELADRFRDFADVLAEVGDRACAHGPQALMRAYERYLETGSDRDRRRLLHHGQFVPALAEAERLRWQ
jgi:hypothetical protein